MISRRLLPFPPRRPCRGPHPIWRRRALAGAVVAIAALGPAACGSKSPGTPSSNPTTPQGDSFIGGALSGTPTATSGNDGGSGGGGNSGGGGGGGSTSTPSFPNDAKSYGLVFLQAMGQHDSARLNLLAVRSVVSQVADSFYNVNTQWANRSCGQDPNDPANSNKTACVYDNAHGDEITLVLSKTQLGAPTAVLEASLDKTTYPSDPTSYVTQLYGVTRTATPAASYGCRAPP